MKRNTRPMKIMMVIMAVLLLSSCASNNDNKLYKENTLDLDLKKLEEAVDGDGYSNLLKDLSETKYSVKENETLDYPVLRGFGRYLNLYHNMNLQVYEYLDDQVLYEDIYSISEDGYSIAEIKKGKIVGGLDLGWIDTPHYFLYENLILIYLGNDSDFLSYLNEISDETIVE